MRRQQPLFEHAQRRLRRGVHTQTAQRLRVVGKQLRLRIVARGEVDDEFVEIEARLSTWRGGNGSRFAIGFGRSQLCGIATAGPGHQQRAERHQQRSESDFGPRAPRANNVSRPWRALNTSRIRLVSR